MGMRQKPSLGVGAMSSEHHELTRGEILRFLGKDLDEFPPNQRDIMLRLLQKIKERTKQAEQLDDDEPTIEF